MLDPKLHAAVRQAYARSAARHHEAFADAVAVLLEHRPELSRDEAQRLAAEMIAREPSERPGP